MRINPSPIHRQSPRLHAVAFALLLATSSSALAVEPPVIRGGSELDFRPYGFTDKAGQPTGFGVELLRAVADKMGLRLQITPGPWEERWADLVAGRIDVLPVVARTPGREPLVDFSLPHTQTFDAFFVREGRSPFPDLASAAGKEIVILREDAAHHQLVERKFRGKIIPVESIPEGLRLIAAGKHDAFLCSKLVGVLECERAGIRGVISGPPISDYKRTFSFAVRKGHAELVAKLNEGLRLVKADGTYDLIHRKWFAPDAPTERPTSDIEVRVGTPADFPPFGFTDPQGQPVGFGVDLLTAVAEKMGLRLRITTGTGNALWGDLVGGQLDVIPQVARTPGREALVDFSLPHTETFDAFFTRQGRPVIPNLAAAAGKEIVVVRADAAHHQLVERQFAGTLVVVDTVVAGLRLIAAGQHDAMLFAQVPGTLELRQTGINGVQPGPVIPDYRRVFSFGISKGDSELREKLNQGLLIVKTDGTYDRIYRRWLTDEDPWRKWLPFFKVVVVGLIVLAGLAVVLQWLVRQRTRELKRATVAIEAEVAERRNAETALQQLNATLEQRVAERTAQVQESEERFRSFMDNSPGIAWIKDEEGRYVYLSKSYEQRFGVTLDLWRGKTDFDLWPADIAQTFRDNDLAVLRDGQPQQLLEQVRNADGTVSWWLSSKFLLRDAAGHRFVAGSGVDITARRHVEAALAAAHRQIESLINNTPAIVYAFDLEERFLLVNTALAALFHTTPEQMLGKRRHEFMPQADVDWHGANDRKVFAAGQALEFEEESRLPDRTITWLTTKFPLYDAQGKIYAVAGISTDVSARKQAEAAVRASEAKIRAVFQSLAEGVVVLDTDGNVQEANDAAQIAHSIEELQSPEVDPRFRLIRPDGTLFPVEEQPALVAISTGQAVRNVEMGLPMSDGTTIWRLVNAQPLHDDTGVLLGAVASFFDITERKKAEKDLQRTIGKLERSNRDLEQFAYVASHDLQEPLRQVRSYVGLLRDRYHDAFDGKGARYLEHVCEGAARMSNLVDGLLTYARIPAAGAAAGPALSREALEEALANLGSVIHEAGATVTYDKLPNVAVAVAAVQLTQLFQNLVGNSLKFRRDGVAPVVEVGGRCDGAQGLYWVRDNGIGIDPAYYQKVFLIFQRLHTREKYPGAGIGLSVCKKIVEEHGGRIWLESKPGEGTTISFTLPCKGEA